MKGIHSLLRARRLWLVLVLVLGVLLLSLAFSTTAAQAAPAEQGGFYHFVQRGQTLYSIARYYGVTIPAVLAVNPQIVNPNLIYAGSYILIPTGTPGGPGTGGLCSAYHMVQPRQTLLQIARLYGVSPFAIAQANGIYNLNLIFAGSTLCIP